ncbi:MAG: head-tail connector protein [Pirellulaceae bacterium]
MQRERMMQFKITTPPAEEPVTLDEAKAHLRVDHTDEDYLISTLIQSAREWVEGYTERPVVTQTITGVTDRFARSMELKPNLQSLTEVRYIDGDGAQQTVPAAVYAVDDYSLVGGVYLKEGESWPAVRGDRYGIEIEFVAGYGAAADVPAKVKQSILLLAGHLYNNREATTVQSISDVPLSVESLLASEKVVRV